MANKVPGFYNVRSTVVAMLREGIEAALTKDTNSGDTLYTSVSLRSVGVRMLADRAKGKGYRGDPLVLLGNSYYTGGMPELVTVVQKGLRSELSNRKLMKNIHELAIGYNVDSARFFATFRVWRNETLAETTAAAPPSTARHIPSPADVMKRSKSGIHHTSATPGYGVGSHGSEHAHLLYSTAG